MTQLSYPPHGPPIGKAYRGAFNATPGQQLAGHAVEHAVKRAGIEGAEVDDLIMGAALQQGSTGTNIARQAAIPRRPWCYGSRYVA